MMQSDKMCIRDSSESDQKVYDDSKTYHDGKWMMFEPVDTYLFGIDLH